MTTGGGSQLEEIRTEEEEPEGYVRDEEGHLVPDYNATIKEFDEGDIVEGEVVRVDRDEILVDIGYKSEGVIPIRELSVRAKSSNLPEAGEQIEALVLQKEDKEGRLILSKKRADYEKAWERIEKIVDGDGRVIGEAIEVVKGGLIIDIGLRGFLPASLIDLKRVKDLNQYVGSELECKIIEHEKSRNNVVLSRKEVLKEEKFQERQKVIQNLVKGEKITGKVSSIVDFGVFVDLGGIDGLIHISELSWTHVDHPSEVVAAGEDIEIQVLDIDLDRQRVSLGLKQTKEDPWQGKVAKYTVGDVIDGKITKIAPFGAFVQLQEGVEALVHVSELPAGKDIGSFEAGESLEARIILIDQQKRRIGLSLRKLEEAEPELEVEEDSEEEEAPASTKAVKAASMARTAKGRRKAKNAEAKEEAVDQSPEEVATVAVDDEKAPADEEVVVLVPDEEGLADDEKPIEKAEEDEPRDDEEVSSGGVSLEDVLQEMKKSHGDKG